MQLYNIYRLYVKKYNLSVQFLLTSAKVLIEKVVVYEADAVEIVWKVGNPFRGENSA